MVKSPLDVGKFRAYCFGTALSLCSGGNVTNSSCQVRVVKFPMHLSETGSTGDMSVYREVQQLKTQGDSIWLLLCSRVAIGQAAVITP